LRKAGWGVTSERLARQAPRSIPQKRVLNLPGRYPGSEYFVRRCANALETHATNISAGHAVAGTWRRSRGLSRLARRIPDQTARARMVGPGGLEPPTKRL